jgi:hypothetical protein
MKWRPSIQGACMLGIDATLYQLANPAHIPTLCCPDQEEYFVVDSLAIITRFYVPDKLPRWWRVIIRHGDNEFGYIDKRVVVFLLAVLPRFSLADYEMSDLTPFFSSTNLSSHLCGQNGVTLLDQVRKKYSR